MVAPNANFTQRDGVTLRDYMESRLAAIEKATTIAYDAMNKRLEGMNEFRQSMQDMRGETVTRKEYDQLRERLSGYASCSEVDALEQRLEQLFQLRSVQMKEIETDIQALNEFRAELRGKASTQSVMIAYIVSAIGIIFSIIGLIDKLVK